MICFKQFVDFRNREEMQCAILGITAEKKVIVGDTFYVKSLKDESSLPVIDMSFNAEMSQIYENLFFIIMAEKIETPYGAIDTSKGVLYDVDTAIIPILPELIKDAEFLRISPRNQFSFIWSAMRYVSHQKEGNYLDKYFTGINFDELKQIKEEMSLENISFCGLNQDGIMDFNLKSGSAIKKFQIEKFMNSPFNYVYIPVLAISDEMNIDDIKKIIDILLRNGSFDFGKHNEKVKFNDINVFNGTTIPEDNVGKVNFKNGFIIRFKGLDIPITLATKNSLEEMIKMLVKYRNNEHEQFQGLKINTKSASIKAGKFQKILKFLRKDNNK